MTVMCCSEEMALEEAAKSVRVLKHVEMGISGDQMHSVQCRELIKRQGLTLLFSGRSWKW